MSACGFIGGMFKKPRQRGELLLAPVVEIGRMKPQVKLTVAPSRAGKIHSEFGACDGAEHKAPNAVAAEQEHRAGNVDEPGIALPRERSRRRDRQRFIGKIHDPARDASDIAGGHEPTEVGTAIRPQARAAQYFELTDGITREDKRFEWQVMGAMQVARKFELLARLRGGQGVEITMTPAVATDLMGGFGADDALSTTSGAYQHSLVPGCDAALGSSRRAATIAHITGI
jgi:hypothetical protein